MRALAIVPARLASTRLPRKMLLDTTGAPLVVETARNAARAVVFARVVVAADDIAIQGACAAAGVEALLTDPAHPSGTDRVREALHHLDPSAWDVVVNVQGDEPELDAGDLARVVEAFRDPEVDLASLHAPLGADEAERREVVKVVLDGRGDALYFSRAPIPARGHGGAAPAYLRHIGVYAYRPRALERIAALPEGTLERIERLEQLRWLEAGSRIRMVPAERPTRGIDTPEDYAAFVERTRAGGAAPPSDRT